MKYTDQQRAKAVKIRLANIMKKPAPDYPEPRKPGKIVIEINGIKTIVDLKPHPRHIAQWVVTINGKIWKRKAGMNKVWREIARLNPPARNL